MPAITMYNEKAIPQLCEEQRQSPASKTAHDLAEQIRKCHIETADVLATVLCMLTGNTPEVPGYKDPESLLMDLSCEVERAACILHMAIGIRELL